MGRKRAQKYLLMIVKMVTNETTRFNAENLFFEAGKCFYLRLNYPRHVFLPFVDKIALLETSVDKSLED